ncbi:neurexin-1-like [Leucoraja erinacea]|uniref:neurexin-1-like n=1 Tax=Leucoraja erinaceus TaxID=7782 RepID=UPI002454C018|nr:neurexin-1-like [Leucoraja erinacea]
MEGPAHLMLSSQAAKEESVATFKGTEFFCYDLSHNPIQSSSDEITLSFKTLQRNGLILHTGKSADYVNLALKNGAVSLVINLGSGAFEALVEPVNGKFNDNNWHDVRVTRNLRQHSGIGHAMVNKLHYLVDIILTVLSFRPLEKHPSGKRWLESEHFPSGPTPTDEFHDDAGSDGLKRKEGSLELTRVSGATFKPSDPVLHSPQLLQGVPNESRHENWTASAQSGKDIIAIA